MSRPLTRTRRATLLEAAKMADIHAKDMKETFMIFPGIWNDLGSHNGHDRFCRLARDLRRIAKERK